MSIQHEMYGSAHSTPVGPRTRIPIWEHAPRTWLSAHHVPHEMRPLIEYQIKRLATTRLANPALFRVLVQLAGHPRFGKYALQVIKIATQAVARKQRQKSRETKTRIARRPIAWKARSKAPARARRA